MEREVGGGIGMGNTCKPMAVSFQCMTKSTTIKKKLIKKKKETVSLKTCFNNVHWQSRRDNGFTCSKSILFKKKMILASC